MQYFTAEKVTERITRIKTAFEVCAYLVKGTQSAALLDTGMGCGDLKGFVESICDLPYKVILSHGHVDHAGGSGQFAEVYLSPLDFELEKRHCELTFRISQMEQAPFPIPGNWDKKDMIPQREEPYQELHEGMEFNLGGVAIQPVLVPGHTRGMMVFLIPEEETAIFGDACGEHTLIIFPESTTIKTHLAGLKHLENSDVYYSRILRNHGTFESHRILLDNNIRTCKKILEGTDDKEPVQVHGVHCFAGRSEKRSSEDELENTGNVLYLNEKIK